jgi:hypothetical protein
MSIGCLPRKSSVGLAGTIVDARSVISKLQWSLQKSVPILGIGLRTPMS